MKSLKLLDMERFVLKKPNPKNLRYLCLVCLILLALIIALITYLLFDLFVADKLSISKRSYWVDSEIEYPEIADNNVDIKELSKPEPDKGLLLLERCVEAEAGNQGELGKAYVCDVVLNRLDTGKWGDTLEEVILYPKAFSVVSNGTIYSIEVTEETKEVVQEELLYRQDCDIISFRTGDYFAGLTPAFKCGDHCFSK